MTAPERIYRDETGLWSRNTAAFSTFSEVRVSPTGVEYIRADIRKQPRPEGRSFILNRRT